MNRRISNIISFLAIVVALLIAALLNQCNKTVDDPDIEAAGQVCVSAQVTVTSVEIFKSEKREGMRKAHVKLTVKCKDERVYEFSITEWVPVVLLGRLAAGSSVKLIKDPVEGRVTLGL